MVTELSTPPETREAIFIKEILRQRSKKMKGCGKYNASKLYDYCLVNRLIVYFWCIKHILIYKYKYYVNGKLKQVVYSACQFTNEDKTKILKNLEKDHHQKAAIIESEYKLKEVLLWIEHKKLNLNFGKIQY